MQIYDVIVIGGGAAGMMAAGRAAELGAQVLLIEKNNRLGKKLSITGGRRCNITNAEYDNRLFLENFPETKQFLFSPFSQFNVESTFGFFESRGLPIKIEDRKRAFPKSDKAEDVCRVLEKYVHESGGVEVELNTEFEDFIVDNGQLKGVKTYRGDFYAKNFILATGGLAAPETGSTGEWLPVLKKVGHTVKDPDPNLAPLRTTEKWVHNLSGTTVEDVGVRFLQNGKTKLKKQGRVLLTHFGVSGPLIINSAFEVKKLLKDGAVEIALDLFPDKDEKELDQFLVALFDQNKNKEIKNVLKDFMPRRLLETILSFPGMPKGGVQANAVTKEERKQFVQTAKLLTFPIVGTMGFKWSIIADGGVDPKEIDFREMRSRVHSNLFLIGDTININRLSGGFSLQLCWTTGWVAGSVVAESLW